MARILLSAVALAMVLPSAMPMVKTIGTTVTISVHFTFADFMAIFIVYP